jgi:hypothetical protein
MVAPQHHDGAARILAERGGMEFSAARADVVGQLRDLVELFQTRSRSVG